MVKKPKTSNKIKHAIRRMPAAPLSRLARGLDVYEFTAADEIIAAFRMTNGLPVTRDADLHLPTSLPRPDAADDHAARRSDLVRAYPQWRKDMDGSTPLAIAEAVLFSEESLTSIDARHGWRKGTARAHLAIALKHFAYLRFNTPRGAAKTWKYDPTAKEK